MAKKKVSRKELLKKPDEFLTLSAKAAEFIRTHQREFSFFGYAVVAIIVVYFAAHTYLGFVNKNGQNAYNSANKALTDVLSPGVEAENIQKSEDLFQSVIDEYGLSKAARLALPQVAYLKFLAKNYPEAIDLYEQFKDKMAGDLQYESLANLAMAACHEANGDLKSAINNLNQVTEVPDDPFKEAAMLSLARLYRLDNKPEEAEKILKEFVDKYTTSPFLPMAKALL